MPERDPFSMTSVEAKALAASVDASADNCEQSGGNAANWSTMPLDSKNGDGPSSTEDGLDESNAKSELVARKKSVRKDEADDIYAHVDKEVVDSDDEDHLDDPVLDVPLEELRGDAKKRYIGQTKRALARLYKRLYGDKLPPSEMLRTLCLAMTLFFHDWWILVTPKFERQCPDGPMRSPSHSKGKNVVGVCSFRSGQCLQPLIGFQLGETSAILHLRNILLLPLHPHFPFAHEPRDWTREHNPIRKSNLGLGQLLRHRVLRIGDGQPVLVLC